MADLKQFEFYVLRYVPYVVKGESVNVGVLLLEPRPNGFGFADLHMTSDWRRVRCLDAQVDIELLQSIEPDIRAQLRHPQDVGTLLHKLEDSFANSIQITGRQVCLAANPAQELERLRSIYLDDPQLGAMPAAHRPKSEHAMIVAGITNALTRAAIWASRVEKIKAVEYTKKKGDSLVFDFGFEVGTEVRFFQAVPLTTRINQLLAVNIAHRFPKVADCIHATSGSHARLTAVVSDDIDRANPDIEFALDAFQDNHVKVATVADMPSIADEIRQDLNAFGNGKKKAE
ncbi:MAG TPA: DUF3037 domain-containing protein [Terriglobales bacterium]|nr:DUF3037 domain-containing protein [Terriglobales bacterium]